MKKRTPEEKYLKEIEDIRAAEAAVEDIKAAIRAPLSKVKEKIAKIIKMFRKKRVPTIPKLEFAKGGIIEPRPDFPIIVQREGEREEIIPLYKKTPPPQLFTLSSDGNKTPFDDKIAEAERMLRRFAAALQNRGRGPCRARAMAEGNPSIPPARDTMDAFAYACAALVEVGAAVASATAALARLAEEVCAYSKGLEATLENYPNKRVVHLALYAKKERVRKKNINRIIAWVNTGR